MEIYRIFDSVITAFVYSNQSYQVLHNNVKLYVCAICAGVAVWLILQIFLGFGLYAMAKACKNARWRLYLSSICSMPGKSRANAGFSRNA